MMSHVTADSQCDQNHSDAFADDELVFVKKVRNAEENKIDNKNSGISILERMRAIQSKNQGSEKPSITPPRNCCPACGSTNVGDNKTFGACEECGASYFEGHLSQWRGKTRNKRMTNRSICYRVSGGLSYDNGVFIPYKVPKKIDVSKYLDYGDQISDVSDTQLETDPTRIYRLNGNRLADEIDAKGIRLHNANLIFLKSSKGSGKSKFIAKHTKIRFTSTKVRIGRLIEDVYNPSVLAIVHRRSLAKTLANEFDLRCYLDDDGAKPAHRYVISLDSLHKLESRSYQYQILILDEVEQIFRHLLSDTIENKEQVFKILERIISSADQIICSDADLTSDLTGYLLQKLRSSFEQDRMVTIINEWKTDRVINVYENKQHLLAELICDVADGKRVYVPVGLRELANEVKTLIDHMLDRDGNPIKVLMLTGPTSEDDTSQAFFNSPNKETPNYQVLISTSTLSTGVSIDVKWFDAVYGIFDRTVYTYQDCDQAISRVRNCASVKVWIHEGQNPKFQSEKAIRSGPVLKERLTKSLIGLDGNGKLSAKDELFMDVYARILWCEQKWKDNRTEQFIDLKESEGWTVIEVPKNKDMAKAGGELLKIGKDPSGDKNYIKILGAPNLTMDQFDAMKDKKNLRGNDGNAVKKCWIAQTFDLKSPSEVTLVMIKAYFEKNVRGIIKNAKLLKATRIDVIDRDRHERSNPKNTKAFTDFDHRTMKQDMLVNAKIASNIDHADVLRNAKLHFDNEADFDKAKKMHNSNSRGYRNALKIRKQQKEKLKCVVSQVQIDNLANYVNSNLRNVNLFFGTNFKTPNAPETKMKVFNTIMGELGVAIKKKPMPKSATGLASHEYLIDYNRVRELVATKNLTELLG